MFNAQFTPLLVFEIEMRLKLSPHQQPPCGTTLIQNIPRFSTLIPSVKDH